MRTTVGLRLVLLGLLGCGSGEGEGTVVVTAYGESFIEDGIDASEVGDGWSVAFERFVVDVEDVHVAGVDFEASGKIDLSKSSGGAGHELDAAVGAVGDHADATFTIARVEVEGRATKDAEIKTFHWVFAAPTHYSECETSTTVVADAEATFQITVHADHLLYDSLVADEPRVLFQPLADADADRDGEITQAELAATDIGAYDPGSAGGVDDLWTYLEAQVETLGHVDGEGHCHVYDEG